MCTWMTDIPSKSTQTDIGTKRRNYMLFIKPTEGNDVYRFRLLGFGSKNSDRKTPYIQRFVHSVWVKNENGKSHTENVICPVTPFVKDKWTGNPMDDCPLCRFANQNFLAYRSSGFTDQESNKKNKEFGRKLEVLIPVYVVSDPVNPSNNNHFKVIGLYEKADFEKFLELVRIERKEKHNQVFNGVNAVDFVIQMKTVSEDRTKKNGDSYTWKHNKITRMGFLKTPTDIPAITKEAIDKFEFDDEYWQYPSKEELQEFYNKYVKCEMSSDELPPEEASDVDEVFGDGKKEPEKKPVVEKSNSIEKSEAVSNENLKASNTEPLSELPFEDDFDDVEKASKSDEDEDEDELEVKDPPKEEKVPEVKKTSSDDLDEFLNSI